MITQLIEQATAKASKLWLKELLSETLPELNHLETPEEYQAWFRFLQKRMEDRGLETPSQQKTCVTQIRNAIRVIDQNHPGLEFINFDRETWVEINEQAELKVAERETKFILHPQAIVDKAEELLKSCKWEELAAGLAVVSGRRVGEVLKTAEFSYKTQYSVTFSGALKRRGEKVQCIFEIPTLVEALLVIEALAKLRSYLGEKVKLLNPQEINTKYGPKVSEVCDLNFANWVEKRKGRENLYTHLFKAVYSTIAAHWYCPPKIPVIEYRAAIQGHYQILDEKNPQLRRSLAASRNYFDYQIDNGSQNVDGRLGIKLNLPGVEVVEEFAHAYSPPTESLLPKESIAPKTKSKNQPVEDKAIETKPKTPPKQIITSNDKRKRTMIEIPPLLIPRVKSMSQKLQLSEEDTIRSLLDWGEMGVLLSEELGLAEINPSLLFDTVLSLRDKPEEKSRINPQNQEENSTQKLVFNVLNAVKEWAKQEEAHTPSNIIDKETNVDPPIPQAKTARQSVKTNSNKSSKSGKLTAKDAVNLAIDKIIEWNNTPGRAHHDKFFIGISSLRKATVRGQRVITDILRSDKQDGGRREELEAHHLKHDLTKNQNKRGKSHLSLQSTIDFSECWSEKYKRQLADQIN